MNKLHLLKKLNQDNELFGCLSGEELRIFLLMLADCTETGEGEILLSLASRIFGMDISADKFTGICEELQKKRLVCLSSQPEYGTSQSGFAVKYRIILN